ncbi:hypothetical protein JOF53_006581 [Crossiella equi]|uniref:Uncharacterized protein n=1 Tax=Crossiella equi TaxID=130796 RepID=A0ABS5AMA7_9PSEU|nr:hypothetical protein [Crossiella equi]MBP2477709.1 hypothetical protein [Crossiella equi]
MINEYSALSLNPLSGLYGPDDTLLGRLRQGGAHEILAGLKHFLDTSQWSLYRVTRIFSRPGRAVRSLTVLTQGTRSRVEDHLAQMARAVGGLTEAGLTGHRLVLRARRTTFPHIEDVVVTAPSRAQHKVNPAFLTQWKACAQPGDREVDERALDYIARTHRSGNDPDRLTLVRTEHKCGPQGRPTPRRHRPNSGLARSIRQDQDPSPALLSAMR